MQYLREETFHSAVATFSKEEMVNISLNMGTFLHHLYLIQGEHKHVLHIKYPEKLNGKRWLEKNMPLLFEELQAELKKMGFSSQNTSETVVNAMFKLKTTPVMIASAPAEEGEPFWNGF